MQTANVASGSCGNRSSRSWGGISGTFTHFAETTKSCASRTRDSSTEDAVTQAPPPAELVKEMTTSCAELALDHLKFQRVSFQ